MPGIDAVDRLDVESVELVHDMKHALEHLRHREVGAQLFLGDGVLRLAELLRVIGNVPGLQRGHAEAAGGECLELAELVFRYRPGARGEIGEERENLRCPGRHLAGEGELGVVVEPEQRRALVAQCHDVLDDAAVVPLAGVGSLVRCPGAVRLVDLAAQGTVFGVGDDRVVARELESQQPAIEAVPPGGIGRQRQCGVRQAA